MSDEIDNRPSAIATPEDLTEAHKVTLAQEHLRDVVIPKIVRARAAEVLGEAWDFAGYAGVDIPKPYRKLIEAFAFFAPIIKLFPGYESAPEWLKNAFDKLLEGADLARRTFD